MENNDIYYELQELPRKTKHWRLCTIRKEGNRNPRYEIIKDRYDVAIRTAWHEQAPSTNMGIRIIEVSKKGKFVMDCWIEADGPSK